VIGHDALEAHLWAEVDRLALWQSRLARVQEADAFVKVCAADRREFHDVDDAVAIIVAERHDVLQS
jgi:hypothetical protein